MRSRHIWVLRAVGTAGLLLVALGVMSFHSSKSDARRVIYNHCYATVWSNVPHGIQLTHVEKHSHDTWIRQPKDLRPAADAKGPGIGSWNPIASEAGFARGCFNVTKWGDSHGTIEVYANDPYSGPNLYHCKTTGQYVCYHQEYNTDGYPDYSADKLTGAILVVNYKICMINHPCPGTQTLPAQYPVPRA